jgi:hypothetical protein
MPRTRVKPIHAEQDAVPEPAIIAPTGVYSVAQVRSMLGLRQSSLRREIKQGRLAVNKRCGKYFFLGEQLLEWLRGGEIRRDQERNVGISQRELTHVSNADG